MRHVQHLSRQGLVKMDHFQKEPPLNLKGTTGAQGTDGNPARSECPLWVKSRLCSAQADVRFVPEADIRSPVCGSLMLA